VAAGAALALLSASPALAATVSAPPSAGAGQVMTVTGAGFTPGRRHVLRVRGQAPTTSTEPGQEVKSPIGQATVGAGGTFTMTVRMPYSIGYEIGKRSIYCDDEHSTTSSAQVKFSTEYTVNSFSPLNGDDESQGLMVNFYGQMPFLSKNSSTASDRGGIISGAVKVPIGPGGTAADGVFPTWINDDGLVTGYESPSPGVDNGFVCRLLAGCSPVDPGGLAETPSSTR